MPLYDYRCPSCGDFRAWRSMSEAGLPAPCPVCAGPAARAIVAPNLATMAPHRRIAHARNEKSAHEPRVVSAEQLQGRHRHDHGHRHNAPKGFGVGNRPWMIGH